MSQPQPPSYPKPFSWDLQRGLSHSFLFISLWSTPQQQYNNNSLSESLPCHWEILNNLSHQHSIKQKATENSTLLLLPVKNSDRNRLFLNWEKLHWIYYYCITFHQKSFKFHLLLLLSAYAVVVDYYFFWAAAWVWISLFWSWSPVFVFSWVNSRFRFILSSVVFRLLSNNNLLLYYYGFKKKRKLSFGILGKKPNKKKKEKRDILDYFLLRKKGWSL